MVPSFLPQLYACLLKIAGGKLNYTELGFISVSKFKRFKSDWAIGGKRSLFESVKISHYQRLRPVLLAGTVRRELPFQQIGQPLDPL
jgi:hypothetical protein